MGNFIEEYLGILIDNVFYLLLFAALVFAIKLEQGFTVALGGAVKLSIVICAVIFFIRIMEYWGF